MALSQQAFIIIVIVICLIILLFLIYAKLSIKIVGHAEVMIVERFGAYKETLMPGLHFVIPIIEQVRKIDWRSVVNGRGGQLQVVAKVTERIDLREHVIDFGRQHVITKDTVQVDIDALVYFRITDPRLAIFQVQNLPDSIEFLTQATLRNIIANMTLDDTFSSREEINAALLSRVQPDCERWGVSIIRVEIFNILPPDDIKRAMEQQIKAERDRRSEVLRADGQRESSIINSRGNAAQVVLNAEGHRTSSLLHAKGSAESKMLSSRAEAQSMQAIRSAIDDSTNVRAVDYLTSLQYLDTFQNLTRSFPVANDVVLVPVSSVDRIDQTMKRMNSS